MLLRTVTSSLKKTIHISNSLSNLVTARSKSQMSNFNIGSEDTYHLSNRIVWLNIETADETDSLCTLKIKCLITDGYLNIVTNGINIVINDQNKLNLWHSPLNKGKESKINSRVNTSVQHAERKIITFVSAYAPKQKCPLAGNHVHLEKAYIQRHMPKLNGYLNLNVIEVGGIRELARKWYPDVYNNMPGNISKLVCSNDIRGYVEELKYYKCHIFKR